MQMTRESTYDFQKLTFLHPTELDVFLVPSQEAVVKMFSFFYPSFFLGVLLWKRRNPAFTPPLMYKILYIMKDKLPTCSRSISSTGQLKIL